MFLNELVFLLSDSKPYLILFTPSVHLTCPKTAEGKLFVRRVTFEKSAAAEDRTLITKQKSLLSV